jgi:hypothetical protein
MSSDTWDEFHALNKHRQEERAANRASSAAMLTDASINFESKNDGAHLIVKHNDHVVDFWPGTGRWKFRSGRKGRGVLALLQVLDEVSE